MGLRTYSLFVRETGGFKMKRSQIALIIFFCGIAILCIALFGIYKDFFAPRIGPIGTGKYHWTTYATYTSAIIAGFCYSTLGIVMYIKNKRTES